MTDAQPTVEPLRFERTYTVGADYPTRFARAYFRYVFSQPRRWILLVVIIVAFTLAFVAGSRSASTVIVPIAYVVFLIIIFSFVYFSTVRALRKRVPPESVFGIGFRSSTFVVSSPQVTSEVAYSLYKSCERRGSFVVLRQRVSRVSTFLPAEVFTDESFEFLRSKIVLGPQ